ncbi:MAG: RagB/SusD family nutrient uptake outer membrane protein [Dysgonamonadaceae bacterium]|nr:RagB/SusD family nutrient uptake outer membrane protein [Dysgonamonadaceae bacterium]
MRQIIKMVLVFASFLMLQLSCSEDFLDPKPLSFYTPENVYVDKAGFETGLVTVRKDLKNEFYGSRSNLQLEYAASDFGYGLGLVDWKIITPSSGTYFPILQLFERFYGYIKNTNVIISRIDNVEWESQEDRNEILSEALFYRSWWYYRLIMTYGDVPFIGEELYDAKLDFYTHSRWAILEKLIRDMEYAVQWLPDKTEPGVVNKFAALHFLSKLYLSNTQFDKAIVTSTHVIDGSYELITARFGVDAGNSELNILWDLHRPENRSIPANTETILATIDRYEAPDEAKVMTHTMRGYHCGWWYQYVLDSNGQHGTKDDGPQYIALGRANPDVNQSYWFSYEIWAEQGYNWKNTPDLRRSSENWWEVDEIIYNNPLSVDYGKPINLDNFANGWDTLRIWPMPYYKTFFPMPDEYEGRPMGGNGDYYVFRLAETYLLRAEAHYWNNSPELAVADINKIRVRANAPLVAAGDIDIDYIFDERLRELHLEEFRHTELVRASNIMAKLNIDGYNLENIHKNSFWYHRVQEYNTFVKRGKIGPDSHDVPPRYIFWPIDVTIITTNTLGRINQNKGYEGDQYNEPPLTTIEDTYVK